MLEYPETKPQIIIDPETDARRSRRIRYIDHSIIEAPDEFVDALNTAGVKATDQTIDLSELDASLSNRKRDASSLLTEFFVNRYDLDISYDEHTEHRIKNDTSHRQLLAGVLAHKQAPVRQGRDNPEAIAARDAVRRSSFGIYLGQVAAYQGQMARRAPRKSYPTK